MQMRPAVVVVSCGCDDGEFYCGYWIVQNVGVALEMRLALIEEVGQAGGDPDVREAVGGLVEQRGKVERVRAHEGQGRMRQREAEARQLA